MASSVRAPARVDSVRLSRPLTAGLAVPVIVFIASLCWPNVASLNVAGLYLPVYRIVLLWLLPMAVLRLTAQRIALAAPDYLIIAFAVLQAVSLMADHGILATVTVANVTSVSHTNILVNSGTTALETLGAYFLARAYVRSPTEVSAMARLTITVAIALSTTTLFESLTGVSLFGSNNVGLVRFGLHRAEGPFPHPILWGLFAASMFAFSLAKGVLRDEFLPRLVVAALVFGAAVTSVSSAALAAVFIQAALLVWFYLSRKLRHRGLYFLAGAIGAYVIVDLFSNRTPMQVFFNYAALDPWTGYYRTLIWQYGWADFLQAPWTGIGYADWARPRWMGISLDAFWLLLLLRYGLLAVVPLVAGIVLALRKVVQALPPPDRDPGMNLAYYWLASVASLMVAGFTVHFWEQSYVVLFFLIGLWGAFVREAPVQTRRAR